jgi:hypothetical protein
MTTARELDDMYKLQQAQAASAAKKVYEDELRAREQKRIAHLLSFELGIPEKELSYLIERVERKP